MPELPEVETVRSGLAKIFAGTPRIKSVLLRRPDVRFPVPTGIVGALTGQPILGVRRRAKYLLIDVPGSVLICHLGMTGSWREVTSDEAFGSHDHFVLELEDGRRLVFRDPRRFGILDISNPDGEAEHPRLRGLGPEPLDRTSFHAEYLRALARGRRSTVKAFIMDQRVVVGVGNIYASEALYRARVRPQRRTGRVTAAEWEAIACAARETLEEAIIAGGSSIRDYRGADGSEGGFQGRFRVYGREGEACLECGSQVKAKIIAGRSSFYCPHCQT